MPLLVGACARGAARLRPAPLGAQAVSFLGDTLWSVPMSIDEAQTHLDALTDARRRAGRGGSVADRLLVARRTAEMGRLREAFDLYTAVLQSDPESYRARRRQGEIHLLLREPGRAAADFREVMASTERHPEFKEFTEAPGGAGLVGTGIYFSSTLMLGIATYVQGHFDQAAGILRDAVTRAGDADEVSSAALWLYLALRRAGRTREAREVIHALSPGLPVLRRGPELRLLLFFKGAIGLDSLRRVSTLNPGQEEEQLDLYGLGVLLLAEGRTAEARDVLGQVRSVGNWATLPYLAAEADLARLNRKGGKRAGR